MPHSLHSRSGPDHDSDAVFLDPLVQAATFQNPVICILMLRFSSLLPPFVDHPVSLYCFIPILAILWSSYRGLRIFLFAKFVSGIMSGLGVMSLHRKLAYSCFRILSLTFYKTSGRWRNKDIQFIVILFMDHTHLWMATDFSVDRIKF